MAKIDSKPALTDLWYGAELPEICDTLDDVIAAHPSREKLQAFRRKWKAADILLLIYFGRKYPVILTKMEFSARLLAPLLFFIPGIRKLVILEFIIAKKKGGLTSTIANSQAFWKFFFAPLLNRTLLAAQVMNRKEIDIFSAEFGLDRDLLHFIPWPMNNGMCDPLFDKPADPPYVMSSGRANCDWETIFAAAAGAKWKLVAVCSQSDRARVDALNSDGAAEVLSEISLDRHQELVRNATIYLLVLNEANFSAGQIRLGNCNEAGTPAVVSAVASLDGYLVDQVNGVAVPPHDPAALRQAVDRLLEAPDERRALAERAYADSLKYTRKDMMAAIAAMISSSATR